jgi:hypothetical protein
MTRQTLWTVPRASGTIFEVRLERKSMMMRGGSCLRIRVKRTAQPPKPASSIHRNPHEELNCEPSLLCFVSLFSV